MKTKTLFLTLILSGLLWNCALAEQQMISPGNVFPELILKTPVNPADRQYLKLAPSETFTPSQIPTEVLLVEFLNVHCPHCQMQTYSYNELYQQLAKNPATRDNIKMIGIAAGNTDQEVVEFRQNYRVDFPVIADPGFISWHAIGGSATPFSLYVRQEKGRTGVVTATHLGLNTHYQQIFSALSRISAKSAADFRQQAQTASTQAPVEPILPQAEIEFRVRSAFTGLGRIEQFSKVSLLSGRQLYTAVIINGKTSERMFAEVSSRASVCDICHDVHFVYLFDTKTRIVGFEALQLTRYGNVNWNEQEIQKMRTRVIGRYLSQPKPFDPTVDSISSATMTSAIIFDSLAQGKNLIQELREQGLL